MLLTVAINVGLYLLAFRVLSPKSIATRNLWTGAVVGGLLWTALQTLGSWLVARQLRHTSELYGFFGIVLGLLFFLFLASQIVVYAAEVNVVRARRLWPRSMHPPPLTEADEEALIDRARAEERRPEEHVDVRFDDGAGETRGGTGETDSGSVEPDETAPTAGSLAWRIRLIHARFGAVYLQRGWCPRGERTERKMWIGAWHSTNGPSSR